MATSTPSATSKNTTHSKLNQSEASRTVFKYNTKNPLPPDKEKPTIYYFHYNTPDIQSEADEEFNFEPVEFRPCHCEQQTIECSKEVLEKEEQTLAIIKPSAQAYAAPIMRRIIDEGFTILIKKRFYLFPEQATDFFRTDYGKAWFPKVMLKMSSGPVTVMILAKENAIEDFKKLVGPRRVSIARKVAPLSLRSLYGLKGDDAMNGIHASNSQEDARREILYFFKNAFLEPSANVSDNFTGIADKYYSFLLEGLTELCKMRPYNPSLWFVTWLTTQDSLKPIVTMPRLPTNAEIEEQRYENYKKMRIR